MSAKESKNLRKHEQTRKRDERAIRKAHQINRRQKEIASSYLLNDENYAGFGNQLAAIGLKLRDIPGDGNCLFRALADQLEGSSQRHLLHREQTVKYMIDHRSDFEPFVEDDCSFEDHVRKLRLDGTYAGNDAIVAFARNNSINVVIHQLNTPMWTINGSDRPNVCQLHISYHNGDHYSSVRKIGDYSDNPANVKLVSENKPMPFKRETKRKQISPNAVMRKQIQQIANVTGCQDMKLIQQMFDDSEYDVDRTIGIILQLLSCETSDEEAAHTSVARKNSSRLWDVNGTGTRIFGGNLSSNSQESAKKKSNNGQPPKKLSNKNRKEQARRDRKKRSEDRKRMSPSQTSSPSDSDESGILVKNMEIVKI